MLLLVACAPDHPAAAVGVRARGCTPVAAEGSGVFVGAGLVLTAGHTVAGATAVDVLHRGSAASAEVVAIDPTNDLAWLRVSDRITAPLPAADTRPARNVAAVAYVWRAGAVHPIAVTIVRPVVIRTTDIYREADVERPGFELAGTIVPGDSGAAVLVGGELVGVVWARSNVARGRAYAIDVTAPATHRQADLTRCAGAPE